MALEVERASASADNSQAIGSGRSLAARIQKNLSRDGRTFVIDADFSAAPGITILFGPSGSGKTTLLDCLAGLNPPDSGRIAIGDRILFDSKTRHNVPVSQRRIGYVFQDLALFPHLTLVRNVEYGLSRLSASERARRSGEILESFRVAALRDRKPGEISGGERQRVALARSLVTDPCLLLLDEPLAALDVHTKSKILEDLRQWNQSHGIPVLYVTHSREEVFALGERVLVLDEGKIIAQGTPHEVMRAPRHETVAQLAGFENIFDATVSAAHEDRGTMTCQLSRSSVQLETPLVRADVGSAIRVAISAGDILLASEQPVGLSARNVIPGKVISLKQHDVMIVAEVNCGVDMEVHLTLAARDSLHLQPGRNVWLVIKTHSCHLMAV
ncbi:MAG TPA: molybdenum ABC transporter ATP-binding protein [Terriglobales bacterium]|jgi:molybdate transport system ATP-binding protein